MAWSIPWDLIGIVVSGDVGDLTIYTDRYGRKVAFPKSPPKEPPSPAQSSLRARFRTAQQAYMAATPAVKAAYETATKKASCSITGQNLWIHVAMKHDLAALRTVERQSGVILSDPPMV